MRFAVISAGLIGPLSEVDNVYAIVVEDALPKDFRNHFSLILSAQNPHLL